MGVALLDAGPPVPVVYDVQLEAHDGLDADVVGRFVELHGPDSEPWSVSATAGMPSSLTRSTRGRTRQAPSRSEYSL